MASTSLSPILSSDSIPGLSIPYTANAITFLISLLTSGKTSFVTVAQMDEVHDAAECLGIVLNLSADGKEEVKGGDKIIKKDVSDKVKGKSGLKVIKPTLPGKKKSQLSNVKLEPTVKKEDIKDDETKEDGEMEFDKEESE